jgi:hypothetical protein
MCQIVVGFRGKRVVKTKSRATGATPDSAIRRVNFFSQIEYPFRQGLPAQSGQVEPTKPGWLRGFGAAGPGRGAFPMTCRVAFL